MSHGKAAVDAVTAFKATQNSQNHISDLSNVWSKQARNLPKGSDCPRSTFLGLCTAGMVFGLSAPPYTTSIKNRLYGETAVKLLKAFPQLASLPSADIWGIVCRILKLCGVRVAETHNYQMDVVLRLWKAVLIV